MPEGDWLVCQNPKCGITFPRRSRMGPTPKFHDDSCRQAVHRSKTTRARAVQGVRSAIALLEREGYTVLPPGRNR